MVACKKELDEENFIDVKPPSEDAELDLSLFPDEDTIYLYQTTNIRYQLEHNGHSLHLLQIELGSQTWELYTTTGLFSVDPRRFKRGYYNLKIYAEVKTGSGSLADQIDTEHHLIEREWTVYLDSRPPPKLEIYHRVTAEGYLQYYWDKCDLPSFDFYRIINGADIINIYNADQTTLTDSLFIGGTGNVSITCFIKGGIGERTNLYFAYNQQYPLQTESLSADSFELRINTGPFNAKYLVQWGPNSIYSNSIYTSDSIVVLPQPGFGTQVSVRVTATSIHETDWWFGGMKFFTEHLLGDYVIPNVSSNMIARFNPFTKLLYYHLAGNLYSLSQRPMSVLNQANIPNSVMYYKLSTATTSSKLAVASRENIYLYEDNSFSNPYAIPLTNIVRFLQLSDNNNLSYSDNNNLYIVNTLSKAYTDTFQLSDRKYGINQPISISQNGKYAGYISRNGFRFYEIVNGRLTEKYTKNTDINSIVFSRNNNQLIYTTGSSQSIIIRNADDFSFRGSIQLPENVSMGNVDPVTGYLLAYSGAFVYVIDLDNGEVIFSLSKGTSIPSLYNSHLFLENGLYLDIENEL